MLKCSVSQIIPNSYFINKSVQGRFFIDTVISSCLLVSNYSFQFSCFLYIVINVSNDN